MKEPSAANLKTAQIKWLYVKPSNQADPLYKLKMIQSYVKCAHRDAPNERAAAPRIWTFRDLISSSYKMFKVNSDMQSYMKYSECEAQWASCIFSRGSRCASGASARNATDTIDRGYRIQEAQTAPWRKLKSNLWTPENKASVY